MKKKLLIVLSAVLAVAAIVTATVVGTVAYMTSASKVSNVFTVGNVFITLDESEVNPDGTRASDKRTDRNSYHLMPGKSYIKDPAITVDANTESCYLFLVTRNQITSIEANASGAATDKPTMAEQMRKNGWAVYKDTSVGSRVWVYCGVDTTGMTDDYAPVAVCGENITPADSKTKQIPASQRIEIFEEFHITTEQSANLSIYSGAEVTINAVGIQSDSFGTIGEKESLDKAWAAVIAQYPYIQDNVNN